VVWLAASRCGGLSLPRSTTKPTTLRISLRDVNCYSRRVERYRALIASLEREIPGFRVVRKDRSRLHRAIDVALRIVTLGKMRDYLSSYQTTIGKTVYVTSDWDSIDPLQRYVTMRHEAVHLRQFRSLTLPVMAVLYVLLPLPLGLAYFRARFEQA